DVLAEGTHRAERVGIDAVEAGEAPDRDRGQHDDREALAAEVAARQHGAQLVLAAPQEFFEIGWRRARRLRPRAPRALAPSGSPGSAALIAPRHRLSPRCAAPRPPRLS